MRKNYQCESTRYYGCYDGGTRTVWKITTPSGQKYTIIKPSGSYAYIETRYMNAGRADNFKEAMKMIYGWEDAGKSFEPDLTDKKVVMGLMKNDTYCYRTKLLIEDGVIIPNLQTAVYLFNEQFNDGYNRKGKTYYFSNRSNMSTILKELKLNDEELLTFCKYAISRDPMCAESVPGRLMTKMVAAGKGAELLVPSTDGINMDWLKEPCFAA